MKRPHPPRGAEGGAERGLEEVERALSVLGGRHPDAVRAEREDAEKAALRQREHERAAAAEGRRALRRRFFGLVALGAVGAAGFVGWQLRSMRAAEDAAVAPLVARLAALGFDALPRSAFAAENRAAATTVAGDCYVAVAARDAPMHVARPVGAGDAKGRAVFCTCASENVVVTSSAPVRLLHIAGGKLGGTRALPYRFASDAPPALGGDDACADDMLAAFAKDAPAEPAGPGGRGWLAAHPALADAGFTAAGSAPARLPFVFVPPGAGDACFLAAADGELTLWALDGEVQKPVHADKGALGWCAAKAAPFVFERRGGSADAVVVSAPSRRVGGLLGLRELAARAGLTPAFWARDDERGAIAADTLRASVVPDPTAVGAQTIEASQTKGARVLVFSSADGADTFTSNEADYRCDPPLEGHDALCVQARALTWHEPAPKPGGARAALGAAYGPLPYWMAAIAGSRDPRAVDAELALVGFARRMAQRGFAPGVIEGVTERADSVEVLGRSGDDAVVAVGLWPTFPFIHPYGGSAPWTLDGEPHVEPLRGGVRVTFRLRERGVASLDQRRTVVFRRSTK